jgi:transposase-like protein
MAVIYNAEDVTCARTAAKRFADLYEVKFARAVATITDDLDELLALYDCPVEHWVNPAYLEPDRVHVRNGAAPHQVRRPRRAPALHCAPRPRAGPG